MVSYLKNEDGNIYAYIEWQMVNEHGDWAEKSEYIYIQDFWINERQRKGFGQNKILSRLISLIYFHPLAKDAKWVYWNREKYQERQSKVLPKEYYLRRATYGRKIESTSSSANTTN